jgi:hypothetical protein
MSAMAEYPPHPLVTELAKGLSEKDATSLKTFVDNVTKAEAAEAKAVEQARKVELTAAPEDSASAEDAKKNRTTAKENLTTERIKLAGALAKDPHLPALVTFAGFLGGPIQSSDTPPEDWLVLYLDWKLQTWMLLREDDIVSSYDIIDKTVPFKMRNVLWLEADASVTRGSGPPQKDELQARFLRGEFTRAGDFSASLAGGTFSAATGIFCEADTPLCCGRRTRLGQAA